MYRQTNTAGRALMQGVENTKVLNLIRDNYHIVKGEVIGSGSAVDAMLYTLKTGMPVGGTDHIAKLENNVSRIRNILSDKSITLNPSESNAANKILQESQNALKQVKKK